jgi:transposase
VCVLSAGGDILAEESIPNTRECLMSCAGRHPAATFVMETGMHSPWVSRLLESLGHPVIVANARKLRAISQSRTKNDQEDARMLARLGRADPALLSPVKVREALVRSRVNQMNSVRFLVKSLGLTVARGVKATAFVRQFRARADAATCALVEPLLQTIDALNAQIKQLDFRLEQLAEEQYPVTQRLRQVDGVGPLTALCFVLTVEDPGRFPHTRDVGAYLGLVPRRDQSGLTDKQLPITKTGNVQLRCLLVNCAHYILGPFGPPSHLREAGARIAQRGGKSAKKRAVIATARKLAVTLLALWKNGADYEALPHAA